MISTIINLIHLYTEYGKHFKRNYNVLKQTPTLLQLDHIGSITTIATKKLKQKTKL